ncbi:Pericentrin Kendrin Pericentrin-B [Larimichthys crocea]|uniref:Pericentrin Kendrin Pericentrin-B n=1 Tax=Larimichthys crocea TaxID=215358 RepID=A0A6G0IEW8_LARCR|nr:Pericentrin Kendrin Pericentrin-B [Larimichthys crocea]
MRAQLEQERRQGEELAGLMDKLRAELLQNKRRWEEEDRMRREELQREQEAATRHRVAMEALKEQKQEASRTLEGERERSRRQGVELAELKERLRLLKDKERRGRSSGEGEEGETRADGEERRQERTTQTVRVGVVEAAGPAAHAGAAAHSGRAGKREERWLLRGCLDEPQANKPRLQLHTAHLQLACNFQAGGTQQNQQTPSTPSSSDLLERLLKENSELTERVTSLSQERATLKHKLTCLERQLRRTENERAKVAAETENRPINDVTSNSKVQRLYERYLRAESFRKALVYQKRYLLLLLGGFQEPLGRFRAAVRAVIAVSRMKFLTKKWQRAIRRLSLSGTANGHASGPKVEVLRQQQPRINIDSPPHRDTVSALVPPTKSPFRLHNRTSPSTSLASGHSVGTSQDPERSLTEYIHHLEKVQQRLVGARQAGPSVLQPDPKFFDH